MGVLIMGVANFLIPFIVFGLTDRMDNNSFRIREKATNNLNTISQVYDIRTQLLFTIHNSSIPYETRLRCRQVYEINLIKNYTKILKTYGNVKVRDKNGSVVHISTWVVDGAINRVYLYEDGIKLARTVYIANSLMPINYLLIKYSTGFDNLNSVHTYIYYRIVHYHHAEMLIRDFVIINHHQTIPQLVDHILRFASRDKE